jgi:cyclic peptide transporter
MKKEKLRFVYIFLFTIALFFNCQVVQSASDSNKIKGFDPKNPIQLHKMIEERVEALMKEGKIPGLTLVLINKDDPVYLKSFGYADMNKKQPVTPDTLFELGSCSKVFTALAMLNMEKSGKVDLDNPITHYFPFFKATIDGNEVDITIRQLLHHTSGIPTSALSLLEPDSSDQALLNTVKKVSGIRLDSKPGTKFEYSTINYSLAGAVIEKVSGISFEQYVNENVLKPLGLKSSFVGVDQNSPPAELSVGYKIGFGKPRPFVPPVYRGNNPAGYVVMNGSDLATWLKVLIQQESTPLDDLVVRTYQPDRSVKPNPNSFTSYGMGWIINPYENQGIYHTGLNPNFTTFVLFNPHQKVAVAIMSNSNSPFSPYIGHTVLELIHGRKLSEKFLPGGGMDKSLTVVAFMMALAVLLVVLFLLWVVFDLITRRRAFYWGGWKQLLKIFAVFMIYTPFLYGIYILPRAIAGANWDMAIVWGPLSFKISIFLMLLAMASGFFAFMVSSFFPHKSRYMKSMPSILILSFMTGGANAIIIFLITTSIFSNIDLFYLVYFYCLAFLMYIGGRKILQTQMVNITLDLVFDLRMKLIGKIFLTSFQRFETIESGRVFTTLNNDTGQVSGVANMLVGVITSFITVLGVFIYMSTVAFWATIVTVIMILFITILYYTVGRRAQKYFEEARDTQNVYMGLLNGLVDGFKELSLHLKKRNEYKSELEDSCNTYRSKHRIALFKFINIFLIGESLLLLVLGTVGFAVPRLFVNVQNITLMSFIIAILYLIGPINALLNTVPNLLQTNVAWRRIQTFLSEIPANMDSDQINQPLAIKKDEINHISATGLNFKYTPSVDEKDPIAEQAFSIGPLDFEAGKGEVTFIVGGNGSGKTTLAKLLVGLYEPDSGIINVNGKEVPGFQLGEYFSCVFSDYHLFQRLYELEGEDDQEKIDKHIDLLKLNGKVEISDNYFSTIKLSGGQRKRLALLQCYLEDSPAYLFDELAADQDPQFRKFFYRELLPKMKEDGKIVIAITHDDHYFDVADRVIKMDLGKIEKIADGASFNVTK